MFELVKKFISFAFGASNAEVDKVKEFNKIYDEVREIKDFHSVNQQKINSDQELLGILDKLNDVNHDNE